MPKLDSLMQLYPIVKERPLIGAYLAHQLREESRVDRPFVYANFVTSLDGRIAIPHPSNEGLMVPKNVANERDWRLFQELAAQADLVISSGRYLRDWADGRAQEILQTDDPKFADLKVWRMDQGLSPQPDIAIISSSLDFPIPDLLTQNGRKVVVFTLANQDRRRIAEIEAKAGTVYLVGEEQIDGLQMAALMRELGYRTVYSAAGPRVLHLLLSANIVDRLYLTSVHRLLGGQSFSTILEGDLLDAAVDLQLSTLYLDAAGADGTGQILGSYVLNVESANTDIPTGANDESVA